MEEEINGISLSPAFEDSNHYVDYSSTVL